MARPETCNHVGHKDCFLKWTQAPGNIDRNSWFCPLCRAEFSLLQVKQEEGSDQEDFDPKTLPPDHYTWTPDQEFEVFDENDLWAPVRRSVREENMRLRELMYPGWRTNPVYQELIRREEERERRWLASARPG